MTTRRPVRTYRMANAALIASACLAIPGCYGSLADLDSQVQQMIDARQRLALGSEGLSDASAGSIKSDIPRSGIYNKEPDTFNPAAKDLPIRAEGDDSAKGDTADAKTQAADAPINLDLPGLLAYAIKHAPEYRSEKEALYLATLSLIIERHEWGPRFFNTLSADVSGVPESGDYETAMDIVNEFTLTQRLPYGGTASVSALVNYTSLLQRASTSGDGEIQTSGVSASLNLPLLRGAGKVAQESLIQAERDLIYAARDFERFRREFFVDISNTYFGLLQQQQQISNQQQQIEGLQRLAAEQTALFKAGRIPGFEADDAEAQVLFGRSNLARVTDNYASSLDALKLRIGMPVPKTVEIQRVKIDVPSPALDQVQSIKIGQAARLDLQTSKDAVDDARRGVLVARDQMRGDLDLNATVGLNSDSDTSTDGLDLRLKDSSYRVGAEYSVPLDRKTELARYRSSLIDLERVTRDYRTQRDRVALNIRDAIRTIKRANLTLELQTRNVTLAEKRLENIKILRRRGEVQPRRLIEAEQDLLDARNSRDQALADLQSSVLNYLLETGQMRVDPGGKWLAPGKLVPVGGSGDKEKDQDEQDADENGNE